MIRLARRSLVPALVAMMAVSAFTGASAGTDEPTADTASAAGNERSIRAMTYNIGHARGVDGNVSVHRTAQRIRETGAEVIALQEVEVFWGSRSDFRDQAAELADLLDMHVYFAPIYSFEPDYAPEAADQDIPAPEEADQRAFGLAVLSAYPIVAEQNHDLTRRVGRGPDRGEVKPIPGLADVTVNVRGVHVRVLSAHLQAGADTASAEIRATQVGEMLDVVGESPHNTVLMGDLNAAVEPESPVYRPEILPLFDQFEDAWDAGEGDGFTFRATNPDRRIDFVLATPDVVVTGAQVIDSDAADHLPVVADLRVTR